MVMFIFVLRKLLTDFGPISGICNLCPSMPKPILAKTGNVLFHVLAPPPMFYAVSNTISEQCNE